MHTQQESRFGELQKEFLSLLVPSACGKGRAWKMALSASEDSAEEFYNKAV